MALRDVVDAPRLLDARNALDPELWRAAGWTVAALGRPDAGQALPDRPVELLGNLVEILAPAWPCPVDEVKELALNEHRAAV